MIDYYKILGVSSNSAQDQIKKAYRKLALKYHPDSNSGYASESKFIEVHEAYLILCDKEKRRVYDQLLKEKSHNVYWEQPSRTKTYQTYTKVHDTDFNDWVNEARKKAIEYSKISFKLFRKTIKTTYYHVEKVGELSCAFLVFLPMVLMGTLFYLLFIVKEYTEGSILIAILLTFFTPLVLFIAYTFIAGIFEEITKYLRNTFS